MVQHFEGGIITEILVKEGDRVERGQALMRVENSFARAELQQARLDMKAKRVRFARLEAESNGAAEVTIAPDLAAEVPRIVDRELGLFRARAEGFREQLAILDDQVKQKQIELQEYQSRWGNTTRERELMSQRLVNLRRLTRLGAVSQNELLDNERQLQQIETKLSDLIHDIPRTEAAMSEAVRRRNEAELRFRTDASKERNDTELEISKLEEQISALTDRSTRNAVLAPVAGAVNKLYITTIGGVVKSGEPLIQLVPADGSIAIEARLSPQDRAEIWPGLPAIVKISAYDFSIFGGLKGRVVEISSDALQDEKGMPYFRVRLEASAADFGPTRPVVPGMLADVDIMAGRQSVLDVILKPMRRLRDNALRQ
jgi:HlyD family type I secretion membrane fusion protein